MSPQIVDYKDTSTLKTLLDDVLKKKMTGYKKTHNNAPYPTWNTLYLNRVATTKPKEWMQKWKVLNPQMGFTWNDEDRLTEKWYPQGITGLKDSETGTNDKYIVVSWYGKDDYEDKGVRISFINVTDLKQISYRHVLLVQPSSDSKVFKPIKIHAGGLASRGAMLYLADTDNGIRVFDTRYMFPTEANERKDKCGIEGERAFAFNYRYILPQSARYDLKMTEGQKFSFASVDWSDVENPLLLTGNYHNSSDKKYNNPPPIITWWKLNETLIEELGHRMVTKPSPSKKVAPEPYSKDWPYYSETERVQGAASFNDYLWLSQSGGEYAKIKIINLVDKNSKEFDWPSGCEDLYFSPYSKNLWCLTEYPDGLNKYAKRFVFAVRSEDYKF